MAVVERDPEHAVPKCFNDLAGHLDLFFLLRDGDLLSFFVDCRIAAGRSPPPQCIVRYATMVTFAACGPFSPCWASYSTFAPSASDL